jgi:hypothetical protein
MAFTSKNTCSSNMHLVATYGHGKLYKIGSLCISELHGNYHEMGRQYGALYKKQLHKMYNIISSYYSKTASFTYKQTLLRASQIFDSYPKKYKDILYGISETSGLKLDELIILNDEELVFISSPPFVSRVYGKKQQCSFMAVWNDYSATKQLILGRNYDLGSIFNKYLTVVVYNPSDGSIPTASITYIGAVYVTSGMNKDGIFLELNSGEGSGFIQDKNRISTPILLFSFLENSSTLKQLNALFHTSKTSFTSIINVADKKQAYSYEWAISGIKRRKPINNGLLVATNHFVDPIWKMQVSDIAKTIERRKNLLRLGEKYKGKFTPELMMKVMSIPVNKGGAYWPPSKTFSHSTSYQIVAVPAELKIWIRVPKFINWTQVNLKAIK